MYLVTFSLSIGLLFYSERTKNKVMRRLLVMLALLVPSALAGLRDYSIGNDVLLYGNTWFENACSYDSLFSFFDKAHEYSIGIGYATVNWIISRISHNPHVFYFFYELLQLTILYYVVKPLKNKISISFAFFVYYFSYYNLSLNLLRQIMAVLIILYAYRYIANKNIIKYIVAVLIAYSFHTTGIIGIVLYPISVSVESGKLKKIFRYLIVGCSVIFVIGYEQIFNLLINVNVLSATRYSHYLTDTDVGGRYIRLVYWGIVLFFVIWKGKKSNLQYENIITLQMFMIISAIMSILTFVGSTWVIRVAYYFDIYQVIYFAFLAQKLNIRLKVGQQKTLAGGYILLGGLVIVNWLIVFIIRNGAATFPYVFMK